MLSRKFELIQIEPTTRCNLDCIMCPWRDMHVSGIDMKIDLFRKISKYFPETDEIDLTGSGESLMNPNLVEMVKLGKENGCRVGFSTNGLLLGRDRANRLLETGIDWFAFSIDASKDETYKTIRVGGNLSKVLENIEYIQNYRERNKKRHPMLMIFFVMMKRNYTELPDLVELASCIGVDIVVAKHLDVIVNSVQGQQRIIDAYDSSLNVQDVTKVIDDAKSRAKSSGIKLRVYELADTENAVCEQNPLKTLFVSADGNVSPCISLAYMSQRGFKGGIFETPVLHFGNLQNQDLEDIFESQEYRKFRKIFEERSAKSLLTSVNSFLINFKHISNSTDFPPAPIGCQNCYNLYEN